jgi:thiol-disulfide isomerase/thioredoxin
MHQANSTRAWAAIIGWLTAPVFLISAIAAQVPPPAAAPSKGSPAVTKIDEKRFAELIKPNGKPLLINFWATWCEPCREEFPSLVKIDSEYKGKIDFITISLDFEEDLKTGVPKFLAAMKATMPTYLLITPDETAAISMVSKEWAGGLPFTVLYEPGGKIAYFRQGIVRHDILQKEIDKVLTAPTVISQQILELPVRKKPSIEDGIANAERDITKGEFSLFNYGLSSCCSAEFYIGLQTKYSIKVRDSGCFVPIEGEQYVKGYNQSVINALTKRHGEKMRGLLAFANQ